MKLLLVFVACMAFTAVKADDFDDMRYIVARSEDLVDKIASFANGTLLDAITECQKLRKEWTEKLNGAIGLVSDNLDDSVNAILNAIQKVVQKVKEYGKDPKGCLTNVDANIEKIKAEGIKNIKGCDAKAINQVSGMFETILKKLEEILRSVLALLEEYKKCNGGWWCISKWAVSAGIELGGYTLDVPKLVASSVADATSIVAGATSCATNFVGEVLSKCGGIGKECTDCLINLIK